MTIFRGRPALFSNQWEEIPYTGTQRRFVVAIDLGATQSAIHVALLSPGSRPTLTGVSRWPGQLDQLYNERVPTAVVYNEQGKAIACGAEAVRWEPETDEDVPTYLVQNFKLHLHPDAVLTQSQHALPALPANVSISTIYADFMAHLLAHTRKYLANEFGQDPWPELKDIAEIVIAHPNQYRAVQQAVLQEAAIRAGWITAEGAAERLFFVEEGEAAARFCIQESPMFSARFNRGTKFIICDAGGSTVDISAYEISMVTSHQAILTELDTPICVDAGGLCVDNDFYWFLKGELACLRLSQEEEDELMARGIHEFQMFEKRNYPNVANPGPTKINLGVRHLTYPEVNIRKGVLTIDEETMEGFFLPHVERILEQLRILVSGTSNPCIVLSGGFGESQYLRARVVREFSGCLVVSSNSKTSKAVAIGALKLYVGHGSITVNRPRVHRGWKTAFRTFTNVKQLWSNPQHPEPCIITAHA